MICTCTVLILFTWHSCLRTWKTLFKTPVYNIRNSAFDWKRSDDEGAAERSEAALWWEKKAAISATTSHRHRGIHQRGHRREAGLEETRIPRSCHPRHAISRLWKENILLTLWELLAVTINSDLVYTGTLYVICTPIAGIFYFIITLVTKNAYPGNSRLF
jgi:hypothetical protein